MSLQGRLLCFTTFLWSTPLLAIGIGILYEIIVFVFGFIGKVWQQLESSWVERTATWFDQRAQGLISRYRKQYYQYLYYQHRDFDVKGLSTLGTYTLELDQVFVDLRIDPTTALRATPNPIPVSQALLEGSNSIWDYLAAAQLNTQHLAIIGPPGSGKTTLLKHITLALAAPRKRGQQSPPARMLHKLPIFLFLRDHASMIREQAHYTLGNAILDHLKKWEQPPPPPGWFKRQLSRGRCLVMLDSLDEVADPETRTAVVNWVERQMAACPRNRFLVTSRPFGYRSNPLGGVTVLEVRPFTTRQVERFIYQWYLANEIMSKQKDDPGVRMRARAEATALLGRLRNTPALFDLTVNPLLLTMIATIHRYGGELPGNRVACMLRSARCSSANASKREGRCWNSLPRRCNWYWSHLPIT